MDEYKKAFKLLNQQQRQAVEQTEGPVLVIAGPGTGKTQLLSTRVGYILEHTDAQPQNILALTFTEAGVEAMRQRLSTFLGQAAYDVNLSTYHAFGSELIRRYPEYAGGYDLEPIDELGADSLIREILERAPYSNPLKSADTYARDLRSLISDAKRALMTPDDLEAVIDSNLRFIESGSTVTSKLLQGLGRIGKNSPALFTQLREQLAGIELELDAPVANLKSMALEELNSALGDFDVTGKTSQLTGWKNVWLEKDGEARFILGGRSVNNKLGAAVGIYRNYQLLMHERRLYDYDDMILRAIKALENHPDFKFTLAEQYLYIMLDEFQDTNAAQFRIVELLTDNPVNEGRPNVLAVGDDDQAIYAFQGAELTNMARFAQIYQDVKIVSLVENYRSHQQIIDASRQISDQISERLHHQFEGVDKKLQPGNKTMGSAQVEHHHFISDAAQYDWIAKQAAQLVKDGTAPNEIAILAPKHKYLTPVLPYLADKNLPVRYEKRENVLDKPITRMLEQMSRLVVALGARNQNQLDALWPEVLSFDFWSLPTELIWQLSWQANQSHGDWTNLLLESKQTKAIAQFFLRLKDLASTTNLEQQLDFLIGGQEKDQEDFNLPIRSPLFQHYFGSAKKDQAYLEMLSDLSVLRGRLRSWRRQDNSPLSLADLVEFTQAHRAAGINILNSSPHHEAEQAINVMTAYQSKGREFTAVFIVGAQDEIWGSASRDQKSSISLPPNLKFMRYRGTSEDERLRLLFVALSRAKTNLYLTSYDKTLDGKPSRELKYLSGLEGIFDQQEHKDSVLSLSAAQSYWYDRHTPPFTPQLNALLKPVLDKYQMSPTHLNRFIDLRYGGPESFFLITLLKFPKGRTISELYGTAFHSTLKWLQDSLVSDGQLPSSKQAISFFEDRLGRLRLAQTDFELLRQRGKRALTIYLAQNINSFDKNDKFEQSFRTEGVFIGDAHLAGNVDKLRFNKKDKTITVYDFKTGAAYDKWDKSSIKLHKYRQQLIMYKLLIEGSHSYGGWTVDKAVLDFVEPPANEDKIYQLELTFDPQEIEDLKNLIQAVWARVITLDFPDISRYPQTIAGIRAFESDLTSA